MRGLSLHAVISIAVKLILICATPFLLVSQNLRNASSAGPASYGNCPTPAYEGVNVCIPSPNSHIDTHFKVIASGAGGAAQVKRIELWADGQEIAQADGARFDRAVTLHPGIHELTLVELDRQGGSMKSSPFKVTVNAD
jgi:hypothetical protein